MNTSNFFISILGGGIAGLYLAMKLSEKYPDNVLLIEKYSIGGRIYSTNIEYTDPKTGKEYNFPYEAGAARFTKDHFILMELIEKFKLKSKLIPIRIEEKLEISNKNEKSVSGLIIAAYQRAKGYSKDFLRSHTFEEYLYHIYPPNVVRYIIDGFGYNAEFELCNAYDSLRIFNMENFYQSEYFMLEGGLSQIIEGMKKEILKNKGKIVENTDIIEIVKQGESFKLVSYKGDNFHSNKLISAIPPVVAKKIPYLEKNYRGIINSINPVPLNRTFVIPKEKVDIQEKIIRDNLARMILPMGEKFFQVYTDSKFANIWYNSNKNKFIKDDLKNQIKIEPAIVKVEYWSEGVHFWGVNVKSEELYKYLISGESGIYWANEAYSLRQGWMEGALEMANDVLKNI
jgi:monoamine oxidase